MTFFKSTGRGLGCRFNEKEKKAIELEARKELAEWTRQHTNEVDAMFLCSCMPNLVSDMND